jgi:NAD(P)-dependent dehydrogenase (short-subunit alcohol dehydrogenase family)
MAGSNERIVTVFGGTGFLGRRVVRHLRSHEFSVRIASRHPDRGANSLVDQRAFAVSLDTRIEERHLDIGDVGHGLDELALPSTRAAFGNRLDRSMDRKQRSRRGGNVLVQFSRVVFGKRFDRAAKGCLAVGV